MRLIDATIQPMLLANYILERKDTFVRVLEKGDNDFLFGLLMDYFDEQPTAYDVDAVVEQLDTYITKLVGRNAALYQTVMQIVKGGGINA